MSSPQWSFDDLEWARSILARRLAVILGIHPWLRLQTAITGDLFRRLVVQRPKSRSKSFVDLRDIFVCGSPPLCGIQDGKGITSHLARVTR
jgi:hypothetical protein